MAKLVISNNAVQEIMTAAPITQDIASFVQDQAAIYQQRFSGIASSITNKVQQFVQQYVKTDAARIAGGLQGQLTTMFSGDVWRRLDNRAQIQNAPNVMLRAVMAMPEIRRLHDKGLCAGYGDRYVNTFPEATPEEHRDYRMITNGDINFFDGNDDAEFDMEFNTYSDNLVDDDPYEFLNSIQRYQIQDLWHVAHTLISEDTDPTDEWNGSL